MEIQQWILNLTQTVHIMQLKECLLTMEEFLGKWDILKEKERMFIKIFTEIKSRIFLEME